MSFSHAEYIHPHRGIVRVQAFKVLVKASVCAEICGGKDKEVEGSAEVVSAVLFEPKGRGGDSSCCGEGSCSM